jgi:hypothetical protein
MAKANNSPNTPRARVGGSGYTVFHWSDPGEQSGLKAGSVSLIGYAENVTVNPIQPVAAPEVIQPLNAQRPLEIITPGAATNGTITLTLIELYNYSIWQRFATLANSQDIVDIFRTMSAKEQGIHVTKTIKPPFNKAGTNAVQNDRGTNYAETFFNVIVASVEDSGETIDVRTMSIQKQMTLWYTHSKKSWINKGDFQFERDVKTGDVKGTAPLA